MYNSHTGQSKGVGFMRFDQRSEADTAIQRFHGGLVETASAADTEPLVVKFANYPFALSTAKSPQPPHASQHTRPAMTTHSLASTEHMQLMLESAIKAAPFVTTEEWMAPVGGVGWRLFVYNLAPETEESHLWQLFGPFGAVLDVRVMRNYASRKCKGFGFVTMSLYDDAVNAINALNGLYVGNRVLQVSFKTN